jgi:predicted metal-dependent hydrolase
LALFSDRSALPEEAPIEYTVRVSSRARRVRLVMRLEGLEVVVPSRFGQRHIPELVKNRREWIERAERKVDAHRRRLEEDPPQLPMIIELPALGEEWPVEYRLPDAGRVKMGTARVREVKGRLVVDGDPSDFEACKQALCRWLSRKARVALAPRVADMAVAHGFSYQRVSIRQQKTRWGSCSRQGTISLNAKLLLMPRAAADYVLLHELCHTVRMDHSAKFWALVQKHDSDYKAHKKLVRVAAKAMPTWLDHEPDEEAM